jgi:hypothetical protein
MTSSNKYRISHIIASMINGQWKQAKAQTQHLCKTIPEKQARKVGQVVGALTDPEHSDYDPDMAARYLNMFDGGAA